YAFMALAYKAGLPSPGFCHATTCHHTNPAPIEPTSAFWAILAVKRTSVSRIKSVLLIPTSNSYQDNIELPVPRRRVTGSWRVLVTLTSPGARLVLTSSYIKFGLLTRRPCCPGD